jgi:hypothetical protein
LFVYSTGIIVLRTAICGEECHVGSVASYRGAGFLTRVADRSVRAPLFQFLQKAFVVDRFDDTPIDLVAATYLRTSGRLWLISFKIEVMLSRVA